MATEASCGAGRSRGASVLSVRLKLIAVQANHCTDRGLTYTCLSLMDNMGAGVEREYWAFSFAREARRTYTRALLLPRMVRPLRRFGLSNDRLRLILNHRVARRARPGTFVWSWPEAQASTHLELRRRGVITIAERVNTAGPVFVRSMAAAYAAAGLPAPPDLRMDAPNFVDEALLLRNSDLIFAPNPFVRQSLLELGIPDERILRTSYGWRPEWVQQVASEPSRRSGKLRFLFAGHDWVRKGVPGMLRAWRDAAVPDAELILAGAPERHVLEACAAELALPSVTHLGDILQMGEVYSSSDVFVFPTYEEGGPQVTFEAAGFGLALLVSPMGASGFTNGEDAIVADPADHDAWVHHFRALGSDRSELTRLQAAARLRAREFTWDRVGARRLAMLEAFAGSA
jgi:glycosyltransferase involved in cell wall biosynthesis